MREIEDIIKVLEEAPADDEMVLAFNKFVTDSAYKALKQIFKDSVEFNPQAAPFLSSRILSFMYHAHHQLTIKPIEE